MANNKTTFLTFAQACSALNVTATEFATLREHGLIACYEHEQVQTYPADTLEISQKLLELGRTRHWASPTLAWYADLLLASTIGRTLLLPLHGEERFTAPSPQNWLETLHSSSVLDSLKEGFTECDKAILTPLLSLLAIAVGKGQFWPNNSQLARSSLFPVLAHLKRTGVDILKQRKAFARDASTNYMVIMFTFLNIAPPIAAEFKQLVAAAKESVNGIEPPQHYTSDDERLITTEQPLIAVDKIYASKAVEIHTPPESWDFSLGVLRADRRTIALQMKLPLEVESSLIDNIIDMVRPFLGTFGARVVQLLYEVANDAPYYRNPVITLDSNEILDRLGLRRDERGIHRSKNRERLRDALNAAHALEIVGEYTIQENDRTVRKAFYRTVLTIIGATFDAEETASLSTLELRTRGLPKSLQIRLNFYDGIRSPDGKLNTHYVLMPRMHDPQHLPKANYATTQERLRAFVLLHYRQNPDGARVIRVTRATIMEQAHITNKNRRMAATTLRKAFENLVKDGTIESYSTPIPSQDEGVLAITLTPESVSTIW
ncbi:MAG: hypothetical protein ACYDBJ_03205 [Aggregatilineales bacterium]